MFGRFLPRKTDFFEYFERHAQLTANGIRAFVALTHPGADFAGGARAIKAIESQCDAVTHTCIEALHTTLITPIERDSIYQLITVMDDIIDIVEACSERIVLYDITEMRKEVAQLGDVLVRSMIEVEKAVGALRSMSHSAAILRSCVAINELENEADALLRSALARLFREERDPLTIIKWKEIFEYLEDASDRCEDVAQIIEGVVLEHA